LTEPYEKFISEVATKVHDNELQGKIASAKKLYRHAYDFSITQFSNLEVAKNRAAFSRWKAIENLDKLLIQFEAEFIKSGGKVIWAQDASEACSEVLGIILKSGAKSIVKSKSLTASEIELGKELLKINKQWTETDLGDYILQLSGEEPSHMLIPALHKNANDVHQTLNEITSNEPEAMAAFVAKKLREKFIQPDVGITGANFIIADQGAIAITENEGNAILTASRPKIHVAIAGIDKVLPLLNDLHLMWPLLSNFGTGQKLSAYNSILWGPRKNNETDGPEQMYVVLIDNGRTKVIADEVQRSAVSCIGCGACLYSDPVYSIIGGHPYHSSRMGPPATVMNPMLKGMKSYAFMSDLSTLSAADTECCPVNINFNKLLLDNRKKNLSEDGKSATEKLFYFLWKNSMMKRDGAKWKSFKPRKYFIGNIFFNSPMELRKMKSPEKESFNDLWKKRLG
jgi:L-lactate dehydrogenase complex protein LldF